MCKYLGAFVSSRAYYAQNSGGYFAVVYPPSEQVGPETELDSIVYADPSALPVDADTALDLSRVHKRPNDTKKGAFVSNRTSFLGCLLLYAR